MTAADWMARFPEICGIHVGGCIKGNKRFRAVAHAHCWKSDPNHGWICILSPKRIADRTVMLHEIAHVLTGAGHTDVWRRQLLLIGGTLSETDATGDYHKRERRPRRFSGLYSVHSPKCPCYSVNRGNDEHS